MPDTARRLHFDALRHTALPGLSIHALRHYDDVSLLIPAHTDPQTGYLRYRRDQIPLAHLIRELRWIDLPIEEIRATGSGSIKTDRLNALSCREGRVSVFVLAADVRVLVAAGWVMRLLGEVSSGEAARVTRAAVVDLSLRQPAEADHARVLAVLEPWWGGFKGADGARERALLVPRLYFQHFTTTSCLAQHPDGTLAAFLLGFISQADPATAYIHFVGVDPSLHGKGVGRSLYEWFFDRTHALGARRVKCVTSPGNTASRAFHDRLGFTASPVLPDYDGPGLDRVAFTLSLVDRG